MYTVCGKQDGELLGCLYASRRTGSHRRAGGETEQAHRGEP
jgi:hypothetical protein